MPYARKVDAVDSDIATLAVKRLAQKDGLNVVDVESSVQTSEYGSRISRDVEWTVTLVVEKKDRA